jgi:hypothetical protein
VVAFQTLVAIDSARSPAEVNVLDPYDHIDEGRAVMRAARDDEAEPTTLLVFEFIAEAFDAIEAESDVDAAITSD